VAAVVVAMTAEGLVMMTVVEELDQVILEQS